MSEVKTNKITSLASNNDITLDPDGTGGVVVDAGHKLGVGTTPERDLHVKGASGDPVHFKLEGDPADYARIMFDDGTTDNIGELRYNFGSDYMSFNTNSAERMRINSSGDVGIGASDPNHGSHNRTLLVSNTSSGARSAVEIEGNSSNANGTVTFLNNGSKSASIDSRGTGTMTFNGASTEYARFNSSGELLVGASTFSNSSNVKQITGGTIDCMRNTTSAVNQITFQNPNGVVGSIFTSSSSTSYQTSSDHRLKENVVDMTGAITRVKQLLPKRFNFIADPDDTIVDGFLAHEAQAVVPEAVSGTNNAVDDDGNAVMQGIDQSKLVPLLTGALQEAITKIETLETEMTALKARVTALEDA